MFQNHISIANYHVKISHKFFTFSEIATRIKQHIKTMLHRHIMEHRSELRSITSHNHFITSMVLVLYFHLNNTVQKQQRATDLLKGLWRVFGDE